MDERNRKYHEAANLFPLLQGKEYEELRQDIKENGLLEPIVLHQDGSIIDGRNRHRACIETNTPMEFVTWKGDGSLLSYVISKNLHRRHLTSGQRATLAIESSELMENLEREAKERQGVRNDIVEIIPQSDAGKTRDKAAEIFETNPRYVSDAKKLKDEAPDLFEDVKSGGKSMSKAVKKLKERKRENERKILSEKVQVMPQDSRYNIINGEIESVELDDKYDFIITDPPYPKEYLHLYETLAIRSKGWLKEDGLLIAMCGQSYLDEIYAMMSTHLTYYWTGCYRTPKQPTPLWQRQVNTSWKPLLIYGHDKDYKGKIFGDVYTSPKPDKKHHKWGQSEDGMLAIIKQICLPGQSILDPFCGAGTTGIAALKHGCTFCGVDNDIASVNITIQRLKELK